LSRILIIDDEPIICTLLLKLLEGLYHQPIAVHTLADGLSHAQNNDFDLILLDLDLPDGNGLEILPDLLRAPSAPEVLIITGGGDSSGAELAFKYGAWDYIRKPFHKDEVSLPITRALQYRSEKKANKGPVTLDRNGIIGSSPGIRGCLDEVARACISEASALVTGESGTGKEIAAHALHKLSKRSSEPYMVINCAAIAPELLEAQLFGHRKGAFTGADKDHKGFFIEVSNGTLFLDEIGELPLTLQSKLLRVLENGEFYRVGETQQRITNARIVTATNKDLASEVTQGSFRADLYHRLSILNIHMPPLCDRENDRILLLDYFQSVYSATVPPFSLDDEAIELWLRYNFPGNVRELRNIVIRLGTKYPGEVVGAQQLEGEFETELSANNLEESAPHFSDEYITSQIQAGTFQLDQVLEEVESRSIRIALEMYDNNVSKAANALNINRTTLYSRVNKLGKK